MEFFKGDRLYTDPTGAQPPPPPLLDIPTGTLKYAVYVLFTCVWGGGGGGPELNIPHYITKINGYV